MNSISIIRSCCRRALAPMVLLSFAATTTATAQTNRPPAPPKQVETARQISEFGTIRFPPAYMGRGHKTPLDLAAGDVPDAALFDEHSAVFSAAFELVWNETTRQLKEQNEKVLVADKASGLIKTEMTAHRESSAHKADELNITGLATAKAAGKSCILSLDVSDQYLVLIRTEANKTTLHMKLLRFGQPREMASRKAAEVLAQISRRILLQGGERLPTLIGSQSR